jgi:hypothetical protein
MSKAIILVSRMSNPHHLAACLMVGRDKEVITDRGEMGMLSSYSVNKQSYSQ